MPKPSPAVKPRIPRNEFARRRQRLLALLDPQGIALIPAASPRRRSRDTDYPFRQDSDFAYLTGFDEPQALLVLVPGREHGQALLFCRERDAEAELWHGERLGPERAVQVLGVDDAFPFGDLDEIVPGLIEGRSRVYFHFGDDADFDHQLTGWVKSIRARVSRGARPPGEFIAIGHLLHDLRLYKSAAELRVMREAARITAAGHRAAMRAARPGRFEYELEAELMAAFIRGGARQPAYECIVGSGPRACVMHYVRNDAQLRDGELVLIDAGCEYEGYAADVTRTFPVNGRFTPAQRDAHDLVLAAQQAAIAVARPGHHFNAPHEAAERVLVQGLADLGVLAGAIDGLIERGAHKPWVPHKASHWLGLDVHDVGDYRVGDAWRALEPGMVMTIEPGLYFPPTQRGTPPALRGVGIRIEDDVLIGTGDAEVLTTGIPRSAAEIEAFMAAGDDGDDGDDGAAA